MTQSFITSIDIMKWTKDTLAHQPDDATIQKLVAIAVPLNPTSDYPADHTPAPRTAEAFTQFLCDTIHGAGMNVLFRGALCELEGIYGFERAVGDKRVDPISLITKIISLVLFTPTPTGLLTATSSRHYQSAPRTSSRTAPPS